MGRSDGGTNQPTTAKKKRRWPLFLLLLLLIGGGVGAGLFATGAFDTDDDDDVATASISISAADDGASADPATSAPADGATDDPATSASDAGDGVVDPAPLNVEPTDGGAADAGAADRATPAEATDGGPADGGAGDGGAGDAAPSNPEAGEGAPLVYQRVMHDSGRLSAELPVGWTYETNLYAGGDDGRCPSVRASMGQEAVRATICQGQGFTTAAPGGPPNCTGTDETVSGGMATVSQCDDGKQWYAMITGGDPLTSYAAASVFGPEDAASVAQGIHASIVVEAPLGAPPQQCGVDQQAYTDYNLRVANNTGQPIVVRFHGWNDTACAVGFLDILLPGGALNIAAANGSSWSVTELDGSVMDTIVMGDGDNDWSIV